MQKRRNVLEGKTKKYRWKSQNQRGELLRGQKFLKKTRATLEVAHRDVNAHKSSLKKAKVRLSKKEYGLTLSALLKTVEESQKATAACEITYERLKKTTKNLADSQQKFEEYVLKDCERLRSVLMNREATRRIRLVDEPIGEDADMDTFRHWLPTFVKEDCKTT